jgi:hypothetical protein
MTMTKQVRIENADCNMSVEVVVTTEDLCSDGTWKATSEQILHYPTMMTAPDSAILTGTRRLIVTERKAPPNSVW